MIFEFILILVIFLFIKWLTWKITEEWGLPDWLQYKPWVCNLCLTFWSLIGVYITLGLSFSCLYLMIGGCILAVLNAIAMYIDQRNKTVLIDENNGVEIDCDEIIIDDDGFKPIKL